MNGLWEYPLASAMVSTSFWGRNFTDRSRSLRKKAGMLKGSEEDQYWETRDGHGRQTMGKTLTFIFNEVGIYTGLWAK